MCLRFVFVVLLFFSSSQHIKAQISNLLFNSSASITALNFDTPTPTISYLGTAGTVSVEAISHAEDNNGNILFFVISNGVYRPDGTQMPGSVGLFANTSSTEMNICLIPGETDKYYIIYQETDLCSPLYYSIVDMALAGGTGDVTDLNTLLDADPHAEGMEIVRIPGTDDYWYLAYRCSTGLERYKIDENGISAAEEILAITPPGTAFPGATELDYHNGKVVWGFYTANQSVIVDFDPVSGLASNPIIIDGIGAYGADFSLDGTKVYLNDINDLYQYDIATATLTAYPQLNCDGNFIATLGQIELGRDGHIYIANFGDCITKIEDANTTSPIISTMYVDFDLTLGVSDHIQSDVLNILGIETTVENVPCYNDASGSITVNIISGEAPFDIVWSHDPSNTNTYLNNLVAGSYTLSITDNNNYTIEETYIITQSEALESEIDITQGLCYGENGSAVLNITGGTPPYNVGWNGIDPNSISSGNYTVSISDSNGCSIENNFTILEKSSIEVIVTTSNALCFGGFGNVSFEISGGTAPYDIDLEGANANFLNAGTYYYTIRDANDCNASGSFSIDQPEKINISVSFNQADCNEFFANAVIDVDGGTPPYTINWFGYDANYILEGKYIVEVTDLNECVYSDVFEFVPNKTSIYVPNAFSPNNDGLNDLFVPVLDCYSSFEMFIYDRWGKLIFTTDNNNNTWDGTYKEEKLPQGVYIYEMNVIGTNLELNKINGHISLIR